MVGILKGIDYSFGSGVTAAQVKAYGPFVMRYLSGGNSKDVSAAELKNFKAAGVAVGFVWETNGAPTSATQGTTHAVEAQAELVALAAEIGDASLLKATVYFAIDEESSPVSVGYIQAAAKVLGAPRTGVYGGYGTVKAVMDAKACAYAWQTYAWSGGQWDNRAILRQVQNDIKVGPCDADADELAYFDVATPVFGTADLASVGFVFGPAAPVPTPKPTPTPVYPTLGTPKPSVKVVQQPVLQDGDTGAEVKTLQQVLNARPIAPGLTVDGDFGPATLAAVKLVQSNNGLAIDGIVGEQTWAAMNQLPHATFSWAKVANAVTYVYDLDTKSTNTSSVSVTVALQPGKHDFKVACNTVANKYHASAWSTELTPTV